MNPLIMIPARMAATRLPNKPLALIGDTPMIVRAYRQAEASGLPVVVAAGDAEIVEAVDKKQARLNCIAHLLSQFPYEEIVRPEVVLPERVHNPDYIRGPIPKKMYVPAKY